MTHLAACIARQLPALAELRSDGELLAAFLADRDEIAFAEIVRRHGPLVWTACRRLLPDPADAEDAFQATFLVLVRRARRLTSRAALGPWLYRVAVWTARNARRRNARTFARRAPLSPATADPTPGPAALDLRDDIDGALLALPEKYRTPLVLCHLQGWSRREAAARLGCPEGTLSSLLSRGLARLRAKLGDLDPAKVLAVTAAVPAVLAATTVRAATASRFIAAGTISSSVSQLTEGVLRMFWVKKATAVSFALVAVFGMGLGVGVSVQQIPVAAAGDGAGTITAANEPSGDLRTQLEDAKRQYAAARKRVDDLIATVKAALQKLEAANADNDPKAADAAQAEIQRAHEALKPALALRDLLRRKVANLENQQAGGPGAKSLPGLKPAPGYLELTVGTKDAAWPYQVREHGRDGKRIGTVAFENAEVLGRFLTRTAKDPTGPRDVRIVARPDTKADLFKNAVNACRAAGLKTSTADKAALDKPRNDPATPEQKLDEATRNALRMLEEEYKNRADAEALKKRVEELSRQREELNKLRELAEKARREEREDRDRRIEELDRLIEKMRNERQEKSKPTPPAKKP